MVQSVLFFILGFLAAAFLVVLVGPAVWRRAVVLTQRRIEAAAPLTLAEIQADKDRVKAGFAMMARKLEMEAAALKSRVAEQMVEIGRVREDLRKLTADRAAETETLTTEKGRAAGLQTALDERGGEIQTLAGQLAEAQKALADREAEWKNLTRLYEEASFSSSKRQIDLVARESQIEKLSSDISVLRAQRKEADKRHQQSAAEGKANAEALKAERKKSADLEKKVEQLLSTLADREEKLERREAELARLRGKSKEGDGNGPSSQPVEQVAEAQVPPNAGSEIDRTVARLNSDRERLEGRLTALARENKRLKTSLASLDAPPNGVSASAERDDELREQMSDLAAEVVFLASRLDGPDSPIAKALSVPEANGKDVAGHVRSLADRVRALQKAAPTE
ncbi:hypothetical protein [Mesorhizobium sp. SP-1A]|uniref:hypothetical protein n=1 Tax=Mesorhizobium sp. SP-1A TaxID=3077840 RepID=UPI0028F6F45B|nr:hypothetical protein [Mesorhizobium sp. SP-1A]